MAGSVNKVIIIGRCGKDPEVRQDKSGGAVVNLTVATSEKYKDKSGQWVEKAEWHKVSAFGPRAETMGKYLRKGSAVYIEGKLQTRKWQDKEGADRYTTEIVMRDFQFLDSKGDGASESSAQPDYSTPSDDDIDGVPF